VIKFEFLWNRGRNGNNSGPLWISEVVEACGAMIRFPSLIAYLCSMAPAGHFGKISAVNVGISRLSKRPFLPFGRTSNFHVRAGMSRQTLLFPLQRADLDDQLPLLVEPQGQFYVVTHLCCFDDSCSVPNPFITLSREVLKVLQYLSSIFEIGT